VVLVVLVVVLVLSRRAAAEALSRRMEGAAGWTRWKLVEAGELEGRVSGEGAPPWAWDDWGWVWGRRESEQALCGLPT